MVLRGREATGQVRPAARFAGVAGVGRVASAPAAALAAGSAGSIGQVLEARFSRVVPGLESRPAPAAGRSGRLLQAATSPYTARFLIVSARIEARKFMARVTVEDCLEVVDNRFELVVMASKRARQLAKGAQSALEGAESEDKPTVLALRGSTMSPASPTRLSRPFSPWKKRAR